MKPAPAGKAAREGISFRALIPNAVTALALCFGLTGIRFAVGGEWDKALGAIVFAGILDAMDGRIARLLRAESRFGAELDSLSDVIAFGVAPALVLYLWSLADAPEFGWIAALALAIACALRLARFNAQIDADEQPHKSAGFLTGVPAPAGAGLAFVPLYLWFVTGEEVFRSWFVTMPWILFVATLLISSIATYSWSSLRVRRSSRLFAIAGIGLLGAALVTNPWITLLLVSALYLLLLPFSIASYAAVKRRRALGGVSARPVRTGPQ
ncbi:MAG TPA: CDP-alcohol phosphatidyltransferase family protein [Sphingomicrobium sp.]|nr:CDP-alcohol phosphatidyltransferase family protein [Sphingomicrobium sp.]